jgi:hypothetical protein
MKQRAFVVVVIRLFAVWYFFHAIVLVVELLGSPSYREYPVSSVVINVVAILVVLAFTGLVWVKSERIMKMIYLDSVDWALAPEPVYTDDLVEATPMIVSDDLSQDVVAGPVQVEEYFAEEDAPSAFDTTITKRDMMIVALVVFGLWILLTTIPAVIIFVVDLVNRGSKPGGYETATIVKSVVYYGVQIAFGFLLLRPVRLVDKLLEMNFRRAGADTE